jgi:hypothetical protein
LGGEGEWGTKVPISYRLRERGREGVIVFPPLVLNKRLWDRLVSYPATHPNLQLALVHIYDDDMYSSFLLGYFSLGLPQHLASATPQPPHPTTALK